MDKKDTERKYIILLKYIYIAAFIPLLLFSKEPDGFHVFMLLLYMTVNQLRFFVLKKKDVLYYSSMQPNLR